MDLRPDAGVVGAERPVRQRRPELPDAGVEGLGAARIDAVVLAFDVGEVWPEDALATEVLAVVNAKRPRDRRRIDQTLEGGPACEPKMGRLPAAPNTELRFVIAKQPVRYIGPLAVDDAAGMALVPVLF
jgi:hypothetical protein